MLFGVYMMFKLYRLEIFSKRISAVDRELIKLLGSDGNLRKTNAIQFRFETVCVTSLFILYIISTVYDIWTYPP